MVPCQFAYAEIGFNKKPIVLLTSKERPLHEGNLILSIPIRSLVRNAIDRFFYDKEFTKG